MQWNIAPETDLKKVIHYSAYVSKGGDGAERSQLGVGTCYCTRNGRFAVDREFVYVGLGQVSVIFLQLLEGIPEYDELL